MSHFSNFHHNPQWIILNQKGAKKFTYYNFELFSFLKPILNSFLNTKSCQKRKTTLSIFFAPNWNSKLTHSSTASSKDWVILLQDEGGSHGMLSNVKSRIGLSPNWCDGLLFDVLRRHMLMWSVLFFGVGTPSSEIWGAIKVKRFGSNQNKWRERSLTS